MTILITGGTGKTGRRVDHLLTARGYRTQPLTRHSSPRFDWQDSATWDPALAGITAAYVTFQPDLGLPGADEIVGAFAQRAVAAGCRRLVLLSGRGEEGARRSEQALMSSGAEWTILRSAFFFQNLTESFFANELAEGSLTMVDHLAAEPFVDADDVAEVAVAALADRSHVGVIHDLTGPELLTFRRLSSAYGRAVGRPISYRQLPSEAYVEELVAAGLAPVDAEGLAAMFAEVLDGRNARVTDGVRRVLGRDPRSLDSFLAALPAEAHHA